MQDKVSPIRLISRGPVRLFVVLVAVFALTLTYGCGKKGEAEKAGETVDEMVNEAADQAGDAVDQDGPVEEAGEQVDEAVEAVTE